MPAPWSVMVAVRWPIRGRIPPGLLIETVRTPVPVKLLAERFTHGWSAEAVQARVPEFVCVTIISWESVNGERMPPLLTAPKRRAARSGTRSKHGPGPLLNGVQVKLSYT